MPQADVGSELAARWVAFDRGLGSTVGRLDEDLFYLQFVDTPKSPPESLPVTERAIQPLDTTGATEVLLELMQGE